MEVSIYCQLRSVLEKKKEKRILNTRCFFKSELV